MEEVFICSAARTPIGQFLGQFKNTSPVDLGVATVSEAIKRANVKVENVDELILGHVLSAGHGQNPARQVGIKAGLPESCPAGQVSILCASGLKAVVDGARTIKAGDASVIVAGGMESMSTAAHGSNLRSKKAMGTFKMKEDNFDGVVLGDTMMVDGLTCAINGIHMGITAENIAEKYSISREEQDEYSRNTMEKALAAKNNGLFKEEIVSVAGIDADEGPSVWTAEEYASFKPVFKKDGTVTKGNACGLNDGASAVVLANRSSVESLGLNKIAKIVCSAVVGCDPKVMGLGPVFAIRKLMEKCPWKLEETDCFELNEAFAAQSLGCLRELGIDQSKVNINGGSIALGHPLAASGCRILTTLISVLRQQSKTRGVAALCVGGGQGIAMAIELL
ncbi:Oidioi.mRNA.OKI2018_I69.PAR.g12912.t1.cds [Oikopleura dioica]|uniref:Oidioi.mRNA.OKI2018_I69.PAR.g12912.t1.cds n=1 Tax=Oikopleura dioica TaxID=34765 RepID=A0ABN7S641_OIKDI|nr:Oidioi.mRNA.OKI2018_I69.PAR.g12912.t1.cds [Oikopleura dioica]